MAICSPAQCSAVPALLRAQDCAAYVSPLWKSNCPCAPSPIVACYRIVCIEAPQWAPGGTLRLQAPGSPGVASINLLSLRLLGLGCCYAAVIPLQMNCSVVRPALHDGVQQMSVDNN
eukprot:scaffold133854_cov37-Tisochrysis_lutea.AAC.4